MRPLIASLGSFLVLSLSPAAACPFCETETGQQVKAGIFNDQFWGNALYTLLPFSILLAIVALMHFDVFWPRTETRANAAGQAAATPTTRV